jgi:cyclopropane fatty-acyl-phospholipid synthase-like methyltransferase
MVEEYLNTISESEQIILGLIYSIELNPKDSETNEYIIGENQRIRLDENGIKTINKRRLQDKIDKIPSYLKSLLASKMIAKSGKLYELTNKGREIGKKVRSQWSSELYDDLLIRCASSKAYSQFCNEVHGKNLLQFNVVDMVDLELMLNKLKISKDDVVLDLGCGLGKITEYIAQKTRAKIIGIDSSKKAIEWAQNNLKTNEKLSFDVIDINELNFSSNSFDVIIAIDVLYWVDDLEPVIKKLKKILKPDGRMGIFYVLFRTKNDPKESILVENSRIGELLKQNNFSLEIIDISRKAIELWKQKISAGEKLKPKFEEEGNLDIIESRLTSGETVISNIKNKLQKRYFIYVSK